MFQYNKSMLYKYCHGIAIRPIPNILGTLLYTLHVSDSTRGLIVLYVTADTLCWFLTQDILVAYTLLHTRIY